MSRTLPREYFDRIYRAKVDPWNFADSPYEREKYASTLGALDRPRYHRALEIGCSIGVQTVQLAERVNDLIAIDTSAEALQRAAERCSHLTNVRFKLAGVPQDYPAGPFDLTVLSEVGYYFGVEDLGKLADAIAEHAAPSGELLLVHWLPVVPDYPLTGDQVHEFFRARPEWRLLAGFRREYYRLDLLERKQPADV